MKDFNQFHCYLNIQNPMVEWEVAIGRILSVCHLEKIESRVSLWQYSRFRSFAKNGLFQELINEYKLEIIRQKYYPNCVSRLTGLYFFETKEMVNTAIDRWNLPQSHKENITAVNFSSTNLTYVDSEWITNCLSRTDNDTEWMHSYWKGETYGVAPLSEVLASGIGIIEDTKMRVKAYEAVFKKFPLASHLLAISASAFNCCVMGLDNGSEKVGQVIPHILRKNNLISGAYYMDHGFGLPDGNNKNWLEICSSHGWSFPIHPSAAQLPPSEITLPDFKGYFEFSNNDVEEMLKKVYT